MFLFILVIYCELNSNNDFDDIFYDAKSNKSMHASFFMSAAASYKISQQKNAVRVF